MKNLKLHWQIIICMVLGTFSGILFNKIGYQDSTIYTLILLLGDIFIRLLKMVIVPLVFTSIIIGVSSIKDQTKIGRLGLKTLVYYLSTSLIAILIGLMLANLIQPGIGAAPIDQVSAFDTAKLEKGIERGLDPLTTRTFMGALYPAPGLFSKFFDMDQDPMLEVVRDTVGRHDTFNLACTSKYYEDAGYFGHPNCSDNLNTALE